MLGVVEVGACGTGLIRGGEGTGVGVGKTLGGGGGASRGGATW